MFDIRGGALFRAEERRVVPGTAQSRLSHGGTAGIPCRNGNIPETLTAPAAEVENVRHLGMIENPRIGLRRILDRNEIEALPAIGIAVASNRPIPSSLRTADVVKQGHYWRPIGR
jgi:hypothetical protein